MPNPSDKHRHFEGPCYWEKVDQEARERKALHDPFAWSSDLEYRGCNCGKMDGHWEQCPAYRAPNTFISEEVYSDIGRIGRENELIAATMAHYGPKLFPGTALGFVEKWDIQSTPPRWGRRFKWWALRTWDHWTSLQVVFGDRAHDDC